MGRRRVGRREREREKKRERERLTGPTGGEPRVA